MTEMRESRLDKMCQCNDYNEINRLQGEVRLLKDLLDIRTDLERTAKAH
jgi:hypothetical protein